MRTLQADNIATLIKAANVTVDPYWPGLFAKLFEKTSIDDLLSNIGSGVSAEPPLPARRRQPDPLPSPQLPSQRCLCQTSACGEVAARPVVGYPLF